MQLIYRSKSYEGIAKDYEFSRRTMEEHWQAGYDDAVRTLQPSRSAAAPDRPKGVRTFDVWRRVRQRVDATRLRRRSTHPIVALKEMRDEGK